MATVRSPISRFRAPRCRLAAVVFALLAVPAMAAGPVLGASSTDVPQPPRGEWTVTALALVQHGHQRCASLGERVETYWRGLRGTQAEQRREIDQYLLVRGTEDLAAAREALDLARRFLPGVGRENNAEIGEIAIRLHEAESAFCDSFVQPGADLEEFRRGFERAARRVNRLEAQLQSLVALPPRQELYQALVPYTDLINRAGATAFGQVQEELAAREPEAEQPTHYDVMVEWHHRYQESAKDTKEALSLYLEGRGESDNEAIQRACEALMANVLPLLADREIFHAPDPRVETPLRRAYGAIRSCAAHCLAGHFREADADWQRMEENLIKATQVLARYSLHP